MTRQEQLYALIDAIDYGKALDHLAALEQQAITAYLAEVPLPEGWTEEAGTQWPCVRYWQVIEGFDSPFERVLATSVRVVVQSFPAHWPAIPLPVLLRAAVQCHRLREGK